MATMVMDSLNVKIEPEDKRLFTEYTHRLGTTPSNAVRMFVRAFNEYQGFPFETSRPYRMSAEAERAYEDTVSAIADGTAKRYASFDALMSEIDDEIAKEEKAHA